MTVYYLAAFCPKEKFESLYDGGKVCPAYRFNKIFAEGFAAVPGVTVRCLIPYIFLKNNPGIWVRETERDVEYIPLAIDPDRDGYGAYIRKALKEIKNAKKSDRVILVCDALSRNYSLLCLLARRMYGIANVAIVTDLPQYVGDIEKRALKKKIADRIVVWLMRRYGTYIFLTRYMDGYLNKRNRPYCIVEGICEETESTKPEKHEAKVCLYAGSLHKEYGIDLLIEAFIRADVKGSELHIYGDGNYRQEIGKICERHENVVYCGIKQNSFILQEERKAALLVNPRPTSGEYTKYTFPSKTLEYMASGTPLVMTKLPGLLPEYFPYVFLFEEETVAGYAATLKKLLNMSRADLEEKGRMAREFVLENKSGRVQAEKALRELRLSPGPDKSQGEEG